MVDADADSFTSVKEMQDGYIERESEEDIMPDYRKSYGTFRLTDGKKVEGPLSETEYPEPIPGPVIRIIRYYAPFDKCDREEDYRTAWEEFERRKVDG